MAVIEQIDGAGSPRGVPVAQLRVSTEAISDRFGIVWEDSADDFDAYKSAVIRVGNGPPAGLLAYAGDPDASVLVVMETDAELPASLAAVLDALGLDAHLIQSYSSGTPAEPTSSTEELAVLREQLGAQALELESLRTTVTTLLRMRELESQRFPVTAEVIPASPSTTRREVEDAVGIRLNWPPLLAA